MPAPLSDTAHRCQRQGLDRPAVLMGGAQDYAGHCRHQPWGEDLSTQHWGLWLGGCRVREKKTNVEGEGENKGVGEWLRQLWLRYCAVCKRAQINMHIMHRSLWAWWGGVGSHRFRAGCTGCSFVEKRTPKYLYTFTTGNTTLSYVHLSLAPR